MKFIFFPLILLSVGCSTLSSTTNYEINYDENLSRTYVYDWCEESQYSLGIYGVQCGGIYSPPVYAYTNSNDIYVLYPMMIKHSDVSIGPPIAPIYPLLKSYSGETISYKVRSLRKGNGLTISPLKIAFHINGMEKTSCTLIKRGGDFISDIFTCDLTIETDEIDEFESLITLSDGTKIKTGYTKNKFWSYRPLIAPAGWFGNRGAYINIED